MTAWKTDNIVWDLCDLKIKDYLFTNYEHPNYAWWPED